jgi:hypothetical protein
MDFETNNHRYSMKTKLFYITSVGLWGLLPAFGADPVSSNINERSEVRTEVRHSVAVGGPASVGVVTVDPAANAEAAGAAVSGWGYGEGGVRVGGATGYGGGSGYGVISKSPPTAMNAAQGKDLDEILRQAEESLRIALSKAGEATTEAQRAVKAAQEKALSKVHEAIQKSQRAVGSARLTLPQNTFIGALTESAPARSPALVVTSPMDATVRSEWTEDLRVMDKLLRDELKPDETDAPHEAMGIRVWHTLSTQTGSRPPMYLEGDGAVFSYEVGFPLAGAAGAKTKKPEASPSSAWARARKEMHGNVVTVHNGATDVFQYRHTGTAPAKDYDPDKVESMVNGLINMLAEARNIRHLKDSECVTVTVAGQGDGGNPARLTLRVSKADAVKFGEAGMKLDEFRKKVARQVG